MCGSRKHPLILINDDALADNDSLEALKTTAMKSDGFSHVMHMKLSFANDLHFPNLKVEWFEQQALPFLEKFQTKPSPPRPTTRPLGNSQAN